MDSISDFTIHNGKLTIIAAFGQSLFMVSEIGLVILDDIKDLMNPHKVTLLI